MNANLLAALAAADSAEAARDAAVAAHKQALADVAALCPHKAGEIVEVVAYVGYGSAELVKMYVSQVTAMRNGHGDFQWLLTGAPLTKSGKPHGTTRASAYIPVAA